MSLLEKHVDEVGMVNYKGIIADSAQLNDYLDILSAGAPSADTSDEERLAYWINAYNAYTVKLIADNYPLKSIKDLNPTISVPTVRSIWTKKWFSIGGEKMSLDDIEHKILRKDFEEPRIHFAINCASFSCPKLRAEAFVADKLEEQLTDQATDFINDPSRNDIRDGANPQLSKIFSWFKGDFTKQGSLIEFINTYAASPVSDNIDYLDYNWDLNQSEILK